MEGEKLIPRRLRYSPDVVTLLIGTDKVKRTCHRALLGFYSETLRIQCYGDLANPEETMMQVMIDSAEAVEAVKAFLVWVYSGLVVENDTREGLVYQWILGTKLQSPRFMNEAMHAIVNSLYEGDNQVFMSPAEAKLIYEKTAEDSKLRAFSNYHIRTSRPKSTVARSGARRHPSWSHWVGEWDEVLREGGDLAEDFKEAAISDPRNDSDEDDLPRHNLVDGVAGYLDTTAEMPIEVFLDNFLTLAAPPAPSGFQEQEIKPERELERDSS